MLEKVDCYIYNVMYKTGCTYFFFLLARSVFLPNPGCVGQRGLDRGRMRRRVMGREEEEEGGKRIGPHAAMYLMRVTILDYV